MQHSFVVAELSVYIELDCVNEPPKDFVVALHDTSLNEGIGLGIKLYSFVCVVIMKVEDGWTLARHFSHPFA